MNKAQEAYKFLKERGFPTRANEAWKYTSVSALAQAEWTNAPEVSVQEAKAKYDLAKLSVDAAAEIVFLNGHYSLELSKPSSTKGLFVGRLADAHKTDSVQTALKNAEKVFSSETHRGIETGFAAVNSTSFTDAVVIHAASGTAEKKPVVLTFINTGGDALPVVQPKVSAIFERGSEVAVIENYFGNNNAKYFNNCVTDASLADGARVSYVKLVRESVEAFQIATSRFTLARNSRLESLQISVGAKLSRQDLKITLTAPGAEAVVDGLYVENGKQHVDNHTSIEHLVGDTQSEQLYKGILDGESRAVFNGRIFIAQDAQRSNSSQLNNNLLLSRKAEVDTKPELEIYADDVKAGHGATIGRLDPEHLFYLRSRSISEADAVAMLAYGFANDLVMRRSNELVRQALQSPVASAVSGLKVGV